LKKDGITVIAVDFRHDPIKNTMKSILTVGKALGREKQAQAFVEYYQAHLHAILAKLSAVSMKDRPSVFLESDAGYSPGVYRTFGDGNMGNFLHLLHANNVALPMLHGLFSASVSPESIIMAQPTDYIMQTAGWITKKGKVLGGTPLGYDAQSLLIQQGTQRLMRRSWLPALSAYQQHRIYSIYMPLYNSPYNLTAIEFFAKWLYPNQFKSLQPNQSFIQMNKLFADETVSGVFGVNNTKALQ
jgi:iron complex transport system substrate-binding protein